MSKLKLNKTDSVVVTTLMLVVSSVLYVYLVEGTINTDAFRLHEGALTFLVFGLTSLVFGLLAMQLKEKAIGVLSLIATPVLVVWILTDDVSVNAFRGNDGQVLLLVAGVAFLLPKTYVTVKKALK